MKLEEWQKREKFTPLTFLEVLQDKPLVIKLDEEWNFVTYLQKAINFAVIIDVKTQAFAEFEYWINKKPRKEENKAEKTQGVMNAAYKLIAVLFEISKQEYEDKEEEYQKFLFDFLINNIDLMIDIWRKVLDYNSRLEKKNTLPHDLQSDPGPGEVDRWRGFLNGRREIQTTSFLRILHEDEEKTIQAIREYKASKRYSRNNSFKNFPGQQKGPF